MTQLIFVVDSMCSWCWGFHPIIEELREQYSDKFQFSLVLGGLRGSGQMIWNEESRNFLAEHWNNVAKKTQQDFSFSLLNRENFDYNTYPACKAIVTVRELWGDDASFTYLSKIQEAFYARGEDITSIEKLVEYIDHKENFLEFYESSKAETLMQHDFSKARSMGANAFPSVVKIDKDGHMVCQKGYRSLEEILKF